jgi:CTD kinase subunit beta
MPNLYFGQVHHDSLISKLVEHERRKLLAVESVILGTICYNFTSRVSFPYVIKIAKALKGSYVINTKTVF